MFRHVMSKAIPKQQLQRVKGLSVWMTGYWMDSAMMAGCGYLSTYSDGSGLGRRRNAQAARSYGFNRLLLGRGGKIL